MSTQNVPLVGVNVTSVNAKRAIDEDKKRTERRQVFVPTDSVTVESGDAVASPASGTAPQALGKFAKERAAFANLKHALIGAGQKLPDNVSGEALEKSAELVLEQLQGVIDESDSPQEIQLLELKKNDLQRALNNYIEVHAEDIETPAVKSASASSDTVTGGGAGGEQAALWNQMAKELKALLGIDLGDANQDIEKVRMNVTAKFGKELKAIALKIKSIDEEAVRIREELKTAASPDEKERLEKMLKDLQQQAQQLTARKQELTQGFGRFSVMADRSLALVIERDLTGEVKTKTVETKMAKTTAPAAPVKKSGGMLGVQSATSGGGALLGTQSATDQGDDSYIQAGPAQGGAKGAALLGTQSATDDATDTADIGSTGSPSGAVDAAGAPMVAAQDFTGTTMAIQSMGSNIRSDAKKTDAHIKKLLKAALAGNWEAVKMCMILLDKRAGQIMIGIGAQTIKSMQAYEKSTAALNASLGKLSGKEADYSARLAKINSEINMYSMNRQAIANFLKDTMSAVEEIRGTTHSLLQKDAQITSKTTG